MIHINHSKIRIPYEWVERAKELTIELKTKPLPERAEFIKSKRSETWGHPDILKALRKVVGNKCWYSEVLLAGADPNIDHFRPKGKVKEIDNETLKNTGEESEGYWWLAFEPRNFRLSSMHSNQRRVDEDTEGGKWDFFPVDGERTPELTELSSICENVLPLDPCSASDIAKMWFSPDGIPGYNKYRRREPDQYEVKRMKVTIWLYHLNKSELSKSRSIEMENIRIVLGNANSTYIIWKQNNGKPSQDAKLLFDAFLDQIKLQIDDESPFAGAKRCTLIIERIKYPWMEEYLPL